MARGPLWTEEEDLAIRERYPLLGSKLELPGRKPLAIRTRAMKLGVRFTFSRNRERKTCTRCRRDLPTADFRRRERQGTIYLNATCMKCDAALRREIPLEHRLAVDRAWRKNNPERAKVLDRERREARRDKRHEEYRRWYVRNKQLVIAKAKKRRHADRDSFNAKRRASYRKDLVKSRQRAMDAYHRNPGPAKANSVVQRRKRRARQAGVETTLTRAEWVAIKAYYDHRCAYCFDNPARLTQDHVRPISKGGAHAADNVVPACLSCNCSKGDRDLLEWLDL